MENLNSYPELRWSEFSNPLAMPCEGKTPKLGSPCRRKANAIVAGGRFCTSHRREITRRYLKQRQDYYNRVMDGEMSNQIVRVIV